MGGSKQSADSNLGLLLCRKIKEAKATESGVKEAALTSWKRLERNGAIQILQGRGSPAEGAAGAQTPEPSASHQ